MNPLLVHWVNIKELGQPIITPSILVHACSGDDHIRSYGDDGPLKSTAIIVLLYGVRNERIINVVIPSIGKLKPNARRQLNFFVNVVRRTVGVRMLHPSEPYLPQCQRGMMVLPLCIAPW